MRPTRALLCVLSASLWAAAGQVVGAPRAVAAANPVAAPTAVEAGDRAWVRVRWTDDQGRERRLRGALLALDDDNLTLGLANGEELRVPTARVSRCERRTRRSRRGVGALVGAGLAMGFTVIANQTCEGFLCRDWRVSLFGGAVFALPGALVGALVAPGDRWAPLPLERATPAVSLPARPSGPSGTRLELRLRF